MCEKGNTASLSVLHTITTVLTSVSSTSGPGIRMTRDVHRSSWHNQRIPVARHGKSDAAMRDARGADADADAALCGRAAVRCVRYLRCVRRRASACARSVHCAARCGQTVPSTHCGRQNKRAVHAPARAGTAGRREKRTARRGSGRPGQSPGARLRDTVWHDLTATANQQLF